jgi:hypothetical protein
MRGEVIAGLAPAQLEQLTEILGYGQIVGILLVKSGSTEGRKVD